MKIPSYDDLTPSIPDIVPGEAFKSVERLLNTEGGRKKEQTGRENETRRRPKAEGLYAALHGPRIAALMAIAREFSPRIERYGSTDVVLDVSGLGRLLGDPRAIGEELSQAGAERVAVAPSQVAARLLARARVGLSVIERDVEAALATLPLAMLQQLTAVDPEPFEVLQRWGLTTVGEFAALPAADLSARLGQRGLALQQLARGVDPRPLVPDPGVPRFIQSMSLEWPIDALEPLSFVFARLLDPLAAALERADRAAIALRLELRLTDRTTHTRQLQLPAAMRDPRVLRTLLLLDLESHLPPAAIDIVTIEADPAPARIVQYSLLERALPSAETLATLNARLAALVGEDRCGTPVLLDTQRRDAFEMRTFSAASAPASDVAPADTCAVSPVMRRLRPPVAVRITLERGRPVRMAIDRQGMPGGRVTQAAGPWRTSGAWWEPSAKADGKPWDHDEWDVTFADGPACRIFRDRHRDVWFLDGVFD